MRCIAEVGRKEKKRREKREETAVIRWWWYETQENERFYQHFLQIAGGWADTGLYLPSIFRFGSQACCQLLGYLFSLFLHTAAEIDLVTFELARQCDPSRLTTGFTEKNCLHQISVIWGACGCLRLCNHARSSFAFSIESEKKTFVLP